MRPGTGAALLSGAVLAVGAATFAAGLVGTGSQEPEKRRSADSKVTRIAFSERSHAPAGSSATPPLRIAMYAHHTGDAIGELRFHITAAGRLVEERRWVAGDSGSITVRNWISCRASQEKTPPPTPNDLKVVVRELFGPPTVPEVAEKSSDGTKRWEVSSGMITTNYTDLGGAFPDRRIEIKGPDGVVGSTISDTEVASAGELPGWRPGWRNCTPTE